MHANKNLKVKNKRPLKTLTRKGGKYAHLTSTVSIDEAKGLLKIYMNLA